MLHLPQKLEDLVEKHHLLPLSEEGGFFRRRFPNPDEEEGTKGPRESFSLIDYAIKLGEPCHLHRIRQPEIYTHLGGNTARLTQFPPDEIPGQIELRSYPEHWHRVPSLAWQGLESLDDGPFDYSLVQILVIPEFRYEDREMAQRSLLSQQYPDWKTTIELLTPED